MVNLGLPREDHASWGKRGRVGVGTRGMVAGRAGYAVMKAR